jgi:hypothetical protein
MKKLVFLSATFLLLMTAIDSSAQQDSAWKNSAGNASVVVHKDPRLELLMNKQAQINEITSRDARKAGKGFRLLVIRTNSRDEAIAAKTKVYTYFPELKAYLWHQSPYYNVKAGNFTDRKDAEAYQKKMNTYFPKGVFVMNDVVEIKLDSKGWEEEL